MASKNYAADNHFAIFDKKHMCNLKQYSRARSYLHIVKNVAVLTDCRHAGQTTSNIKQ